MKTITVVIPSYNTDYDTMVRTIMSVTSQSLSPLEILIVDDNGGNEFTEINERIEREFKKHRVRVVYNDKNMGANFTRNHGVKKAKGDYIAFLDSDDTWSYDYLKTVTEIIKTKNAKFVTSNYQIVHKDGTLPPEFNERDFPSGDISKKELYKDVVGPTSTVVVDRQTLIDAGLFDEEMPARQDYDMWLRVCKLVPLYYNYKPTVWVYRDGHASISSSYKRNVKGTQMVLHKILSTNQLSELEQKAIKASHYKHMAKACILCNAYTEARAFAKKSMFYKFDKTVSMWYVFSCCPFIFTKLRELRRKVLYR